MKSRIVIAGALALAAASARADYVCRTLDVPGSTNTQTWQINKAGQLALTGDSGGYIYSAGAFLPLPAPPSSTGIDRSHLGALGLNDYGVIAGVGYNADGSSYQTFLLENGSYSFFAYPSPLYPNSEARGLGNNDVVVGVASAADNSSGVGFAYSAKGATGYAAGFTTIIPTLPSGQQSWFTIPGGMNDAGQFVGSARFYGHGVYGFVYTPGQPISLFRVSTGVGTRARAINNKGQIVGASNTPYGTQGFLRDADGDHFFTCPALNGVGGIFPEGLNDSGLVDGSYYDAQGNIHGFVAYPSIAAALEDLESAVTSQGPGGSLEAKIDAAVASYAAGKKEPACAKLESFVAEVAAQSGQSLDAQVATSFTAEAQAIASALACQ